MKTTLVPKKLQVSEIEQELINQAKNLQEEEDWASRDKMQIMLHLNARFQA